MLPQPLLYQRGSCIRLHLLKLLAADFVVVEVDRLSRVHRNVLIMGGALLLALLIVGYFFYRRSKGEQAQIDCMNLLICRLQQDTTEFVIVVYASACHRLRQGADGAV